RWPRDRRTSPWAGWRLRRGPLRGLSWTGAERMASTCPRGGRTRHRPGEREVPAGDRWDQPFVCLRSGDRCPRELTSFIGSTRTAEPFSLRPPFAGFLRIHSPISSLQRHGHSVPAPDAQGREPVVHVLLFHGVQQRDNDAIPRAADRMAQGDGAPADVEDLPRDAELLPYTDTRGGERLIVLDQIELIELHPGRGLCQGLAVRIRPDPAVPLPRSVLAVDPGLARDDLLREPAGFGRLVRERLRAQGVFIAHLSRESQTLRHDLSADGHVEVVVDVPETIRDHRVEDLGVAEVEALAGPRHE